MAEPTYPIFIFEDSDLSIISSSTQVQTDLERIDVESGVFEAYDSDGRRVYLTNGRARIEVDVDSMERAAISEFEMRLRTFLRASGDQTADDLTLDLVWLKAAAQKYA
jgi:hypothetical protein